MKLQHQRIWCCLDLPAESVEQQGALAQQVAEVLGAHRVVMGRSERLGDPDPLDGTGELRCRKLRLLPGDQIPDRLPRLLVLGTVDAHGRLYLSIRPRDGEAWAFSSSDARDAERLLEAGLWWEAEGGESREDLIELFASSYRAP